MRIIRHVLLYNNFMLLTIAFISCNNNSGRNATVCIALNQSLTTSNIFLHRSTERLSAEIEQKLADPTTFYKANIWMPKVRQVIDAGVSITKFLDSLKKQLSQKAGIEISNPNEIFLKNRNDVVKEVLANADNILLGKFQEYKARLMSIDSSIWYAFNETIVVTSSADSSEKQDAFVVHPFDEDITLPEAFLLLGHYQNMVAIIENRVVQFCRNKIGEPEDWFDIYSAIVAQNSNHILDGEAIEITAGLGAFSKRANPYITIAGKHIPLDENGTANYKQKFSGKIGKHSIHVKIIYTDALSQLATIEKDVEFTVDKKTQ